MVNATQSTHVTTTRSWQERAAGGLDCDDIYEKKESVFIFVLERGQKRMLYSDDGQA